MAQKEGKSHKIGRQTRNACDKSQKGRTARNKQAEIERSDKLAARLAFEVSDNCLKKRQKRERRREFMAIPRSDRAKMQSPSQAGERQFGEMAKPWHTHQRVHGLATALTPKEWDAKTKRESKAKKEKASPFASISV